MLARINPYMKADPFHQPRPAFRWAASALVVASWLLISAIIIGLFQKAGDGRSPTTRDGLFIWSFELVLVGTVVLMVWLKRHNWRGTVRVIIGLLIAYLAWVAIGHSIVRGVF